jgi:hypothetical protein
LVAFSKDVKIVSVVRINSESLSSSSMSQFKFAIGIAAPVAVGVGFLYLKTRISTKGQDEVLKAEDGVNKVKASYLSASLLQSISNKKFRFL